MARRSSCSETWLKRGGQGLIWTGWSLARDWSSRYILQTVKVLKILSYPFDIILSHRQNMERLKFKLWSRLKDSMFELKVLLVYSWQTEPQPAAKLSQKFHLQSVGGCCWWISALIFQALLCLQFETNIYRKTWPNSKLIQDQKSKLSYFLENGNQYDVH